VDLESPGFEQSSHGLGPASGIGVRPKHRRNGDPGFVGTQ
jgi:hypothetical protein